MRKRKSEPLRMCTGCREMKPKTELVRYFINEAGEPEVDETGKSGGRGVYVCRAGDCLQRALKSNSIARGLKIRS